VWCAYGTDFQLHIYADSDTVFAVSRPVGTDKSTTNGTDKSVPYKGAVQNSASHLRYAKRYGFHHYPEPGTNINV